jgi:uncharacterized Zn finger protein (UPF0148 family)
MGRKKMNIKIEITAPGLEKALNNLAGSFGQIGVPVVATSEKTKEEPKQEKDKKQDKKEDKPPKQKEPDVKKEPEAEKEPEADAPPEDDALKVSLEEVREKLATLAKAGKQAEVKELITSFDAKKLTDIDQKHFAEVIKKAEKL